MKGSAKKKKDPDEDFGDIGNRAVPLICLANLRATLK